MVKKQSDRAGVVPPSFRRKTTLQYKSLPPIAIPARFVSLEREAQDFAQVKFWGRQQEVRCAMAASAMVGQQMEMMGSRVKAQSRAESLTARNRELYETRRRVRRVPTTLGFCSKEVR